MLPQCVLLHFQRTERKIKSQHIQSSVHFPVSLALPHSQVEYGAWMAAHVAVFRLVPAQSEFDETHSALPGVAAQRTTGFRLPAEAAVDVQVRLEKETEMRNQCPVQGGWLLAIKSSIVE